jgi:hypothetical protein
MADPAGHMSDPATTAFERWARAGLELIGIEPSDADLAVMAAIEEIYRPDMAALMEADLTNVEAERDLDLARAPE